MSNVLVMGVLTYVACVSIEQIKMLTGYTARPDFLKKLTWIAVNHHPKVTHVDTVRAFHFGSNFLVEVSHLTCLRYALLTWSGFWTADLSKTVH